MIKLHTTGARKGADFLAHVDPAQLKAQGVEIVGFYLKRARACEAAFGSQSYHRDRYAKIQGY